MLNVLPKDNSKHTEDISCPCKPTIHYRGLLPVLIHNEAESIDDFFTIGIVRIDGEIIASKETVDNSVNYLNNTCPPPGMTSGEISYGSFNDSDEITIKRHGST